MGRVVRNWVLVVFIATTPLLALRAAWAGAPNAATQAVAAPPGYRVVNASPFGQAISIRKAGIASVRAGLIATFRDLSRFFGSKPTVKAAYEDSRDHRSGGASFVANVRGWPVKGNVFCRLGPKGAVVAVVYGRPDTPPEEWRRLASAPGVAATAAGTPNQPTAPATQPSLPSRVASGARDLANGARTLVSGGPAPGGDTPLPPAAHAHLTDYRMPDGTGSVGLAPGWRTNSRTLLSGVILEGPGDQRVLIGMASSVLSPNSQMARNQQQYPTATPMFVAPFTTPIEAFRILVPQISRQNVRVGAPASEVDNLTQRSSAKSPSPNGRAAILQYGVTDTGRGGRKHYKEIAQIDMAPLGGSVETWLYTVNAVRAPDATFEHDLPLMLQLAASLKENAQVIMSKTHQNIAASERRTAQTLDQARQQGGESA